MQDRQEQLAQIYHDLRVYLKQQGMEEPIVCGDGVVQAWMFMLGEAPGAEEVREGRPFVGKAGKNLDAFLLQTGIEREQIFISNVVKFRPYRIGPTGRRANRPPNRQEKAWCLPFLERELALLQPKLVVTLGNTALQAMLGDQALIGAYHGSCTKDAKGRNIFPLYHPASIIYNQKLKEVYAQDLIALRTYLEGGATEGR